MAKKGDWVLLKSTVLNPGERAPQVPGDTALVPLLQWVKGHLLEDAQVGQTASALTLTGRVVKGEVVAVNPGYSHSFGSYIPELETVRSGILKALWGAEDEP